MARWKTVCDRQTDGQTDRRMDGQTDRIAVASTALGVKKKFNYT